MSEAPSLEDLLERRLPSGLHRLDEALAAGAEDPEIANAKGAVAAVALANVSREAPSGSLRDRVLASCQREGRFGVFADRVARLFDVSVSEAASLLTTLERPDAWTPFLVEGVEMMAVTAGPKCGGALATFVRFRPGTVFPEHAHGGDETMLVLDGGFREQAEHGEEAWRGDEMIRSEGSAHALVALPGVPCVAAVLLVGSVDFA